MKKRYLVIFALLATFAGVIELGITRQHAVKAAQSIISQDNAGTDVQSDIASLTDYVHSHMRTSLTFGLGGSYQRAAQAAEAAQAPKADASVYPAALAACQVRNPVATAQCIQNYVQTHAAPGVQPVPAKLPDPNAFVYHLDAPSWSPDVAGLCFLAALLGIVTAAWLSLFGSSH